MHSSNVETASAPAPAAAARHQADIDHAVGMLISARVSLMTWYRSLTGLCQRESTLENALEAAGLEPAQDEAGKRVLIVDVLDPFSSAGGGR